MFAELFIASEEQCVAIPESTSLRVAACAEPLGVTLHAVARAGAMLGRKVLITGSGPIGVLVAASARLAGAAEIVVTGYFDVAFEASGNARALENCIGVIRPGGRIVQVGILPAGQSALPMNKVVAKELELIGTFLSNEEFRWAVDALVYGRIDIGPILSGEFPLADAISAFELASDRSKAMKVSLVASD
jgi:L-idonate 5-dehydrogenase